MEVVFNKLNYIENKDTSLERICLLDVDISISQGEIVGIAGENLGFIGELITAIKRPNKGEVRLGNVIIKRSSHINNVNDLRKKIGFVKTNMLFFGGTVKEEIKLVMKNFGYKTNNVTKHIVDSLKIVGLDESFLERNPNTLSFTEKKKVCLASVMAYNPEVIILEDFEKGFIYREREYFRKLFLKLKNKFNKTVILLGTDMSFWFDIVNKVYVINKGKVLVSGDKDIFYEDKLYKYLYMPPIVSFTKYAQELGHDILEYTDMKELLKELYRKC